MKGKISMFRKIYVFMLCISFILWPDSIEAAKVTPKKFTGAILTDCDIYQLGMNEFVLKLYGKEIPAPTPEFYDNTMHITLDNTQVKNIQAMKYSVENLANAVPITTDFRIDNISDDKNELRQVELEIDADRPMEFVSGSRSFESYSLRIKLCEEEFQFEKFTTPPKRDLIAYPQAFLPFRFDRRITIELRDAELQDVIRLLLYDSGFNVIINNTFPKGDEYRLSMTLNDVRIDEIVNHLMNQYDVACYMVGDKTIVFGARDNLYKLSGKTEIKSFKIAYANLADVGTMLKNLVALQDTEFTQDERMRTIYVNTNPAKMEEVEDLINRIDIPARQVMIRASIFEFNDSANLDVQNTLNMVYDRWTLTSNPSGGIGQINYQDMTYRNGKTNFDRYITSALNALETKNKGKTIANPSVIAIEGQAASITLKEDILYSKGTDDDGHQEWDTVNVGPELQFTPLIEENGYINLDISINTGDYLGKDIDGNIRTTTRTVKTKIRVRDGMPFVVGGLNQDNKIKTRAHIPIIGDIPLLGKLFEYSSTEHSKSQAVMIVVPYILDTK